MRNRCSNVTHVTCEAPANGPGPAPRTLVRCYRCGGAVCRTCSGGYELLRYTYTKGRRVRYHRTCDNCLLEMGRCGDLPREVYEMEARRRQLIIEQSVSPSTEESTT